MVEKFLVTRVDRDSGEIFHRKSAQDSKKKIVVSSYTRLETEELYSILGLETILFLPMRWCAGSYTFG